MVTKAELRSSIETFLVNMGNKVADAALGDVPVVGQMNLPVGEALFGLISDEIDAALAAAGNTAEELVAALDDLPLISASIVDGDIMIDIDATAAVELIDVAFGAGGFVGGIGLEIGGEFDTTLNAELHVALRVDGDDASVWVLDNGGAKEVSVSLEANLRPSVNGSLGFLDISVTDHDEDEPELNLSATIDLATGLAATAIGAITPPELDGSAKIDLDIVTSLVGILPDFSANFVMDFNLQTLTPSVAFNDVSIELGSLFETFGGFFDEVNEILNSGPLGEILDFMFGPLPVIDRASEKAGLDTWLDTLPEFIKDGDVSLADLAVAFDNLISIGGSDQSLAIADFFRTLSYVDLIRDLTDMLSEGKINLGSFAVAENPLDSVASFIGIDPTVAFQALDDFVKDSGIFDEAPDLAGAFSDEFKINIPLLDNPSLVINILFNQLFDPVTIVEFDLPKLAFDAGVDLFFPILGPIGVGLEAQIRGMLDFAVGYDTLALETRDFLDGLYIATLNDAGIPEPGRIVASMDARFAGNAGVDVGIASAKIAGGVNFVANGYLHDDDSDGKTRLSDVGECLLDPLSGRAWADLAAVFKVGIGFLSAKKTFTIAKAEFANFTYTVCEPGVSPPGLGLAELKPDGDVLLHTGALAPLRHISGTIGNDNADPEYYQIGNARDADGNLKAGVLAISGFGVNQEYGGPGTPAVQVVGDLGNLDDSLIVAADVTQSIRVNGGGGHDFMVGGAGNDELIGGSGDDDLNGGAGNDSINGGEGDDRLDGGAGADTLVGGTGFLFDSDYDEVTYEEANAGTGVGVRLYLNTATGYVEGYGGEAEGDRLLSIEQITGTQYDDEIQAGNSSLVSKTLFGLDGNDTLVGSFTGDFLLGGVGADYMDGGAGVDGTSYAFSWGSVYVDLVTHRGYGAEAQGDYLVSIEQIQGSIFGDTLYGDSTANTFDGANGNDWLDGRGGFDVIYAGGGNDTVFGRGDGDRLDGGGTVGFNEQDLLTYRNVTDSAVEVNLGEGFGRRTGNIFFADQISFAWGTVLGVAMPVPGISTFERLEGTNIAGLGDLLTGDNQDNRILGLAGNDTINGGSGHDRLIGGLGADRMDGGLGLDWAEYRDSSSGVTVYTTGTAGVGGTAQGDVLSTVENLLGSDYSDTLLGDDGANVFDVGLSTAGIADYAFGGFGVDTLILDYSRGDYGRGLVGGFGYGALDNGSFERLNSAGTQTLDSVLFDSFEQLQVVGTRQNDTIYGGLYADQISTGLGDDIIYAGTGIDFVDAGGGNDWVAYGTDAYLNLITYEPSYGAFFLNGGAGMDALSYSFITYDDVNLSGRETEFRGINMTLGNGSVAMNFEILGDIRTGYGDDSLTQNGQYDNDFWTGAGSDTIRPGLGFDSVDAGASYHGLRRYGEGEGSYWDIDDLETFLADRGDRLFLDYSSLTDSYGVQSSTYRHFQYIGGSIFDGNESLQTNAGYYYTYSESTGQLTNYLSFDGIESINVIGSDFADVLVGTHIDIEWLPRRFYDSFVLDVVDGQFSDRVDTSRGADVLEGRDGNDWLIGYSGNDRLYGGDGEDRLEGSRLGTQVGEAPYSNIYADQGEFDFLEGGAGADTFILGDSAQSHYVEYEYDVRLGASDGRASINDFNAAEGDTLVMHGWSGEYFTVLQGDTTLIYKQVTGSDNTEGFQANSGDGARSDLIATLNGVTEFDLDGDYVTYLDYNWDRAALRSSSVDIAPLLPSASEARLEAPVQAGPTLQALATPGVDWAFVADVAELQSRLSGGSGVVAGSESLTIEGSSEGFGYFEDDPFGLGSGIVLSTGRVEDLDEANISAGLGGSLAKSIPLEFTFIGRAGGSDIYRIDLSNLGIDINSFRLSDANSKDGGSGGRASGFDVDAFVFSSKYLGSVALDTDLNDEAFLPREDVLSLDMGHLFLDYGGQHSPDNGWGFGPDGIGAENGLVLDAWSRFNFFAPNDAGNNEAELLSLGDGGSLGIDLGKTLRTDGPMYLYVAEYGGTGENVIGEISVSSDFTIPTGDLSTDLGAPGLDGDTTRMTYNFTPVDGTDLVRFEVVIFSEELPENAGISLADIINVTLNGVSIASLSDGTAAELNNLMNSPFVAHSDLVLNAPTTGIYRDVLAADAFTKTLTFVGRVEAGMQNSLVVEVSDQRNAYLDTGVLIKSASFLNSGGALAANLAPFAIGEIFHLAVDGTANGSVLGNDNDPEGSALTAIQGSGPSHGDLSFLADGTFVYTPDAGFEGIDTFTYRANDGTQSGNLATVTFRVGDPDFGGGVGDNRAPTDIALSNDTISEDAAAGAVVGLLTATDPDGDAVTFALAGSSPFVLDGNQIKVASLLDFETRSSWTVTVTADDGQGGSYSEDLVINVSDVLEPVEPTGPVLDFGLAKEAVEPGAPTTTWRNPLTNLVYSNGSYSGPSSPLTDPTGAALARFYAEHGDVDVSRIEFAGAGAIDPTGAAAALVVDWTGTDARLELRSPWNSVKNIQLNEFTGGTLTVVNLVSVVVDWGLSDDDHNLIIEGAKRGSLVTGNGDDTIFVSAYSNGADWGNLFQISTGDGDDVVTVTNSGRNFGPGPNLKAQTVSLVSLGEGNDRFTGGAGVDEVDGGDGDDYLDGKGGIDVLRGVAGDDTYIVDNTADVVDEFSNIGFDAGGHDLVISSADFTLPDYVEDLRLTGSAVIGFGNGYNNHITGSSGANDLYGDGGNDTLSGKAGQDRLFGGEGNDLLSGGEGSDWLYGQSGSDRLTGGLGVDYFVFDTEPDNADRVEDFTVGTDFFVLDSYVFQSLMAGSLGADQFEMGSKATTEDTRVIYDGVKGRLYYDADGLGGDSQQTLAIVTPGLLLDESSFVVV